jgi:hypothetical protein
MSTLLKVAQMSGGTVALLSGGTYDGGTKVAASKNITFILGMVFGCLLQISGAWVKRSTRP